MKLITCGISNEIIARCVYLQLYRKYVNIAYRGISGNHNHTTSNLAIYSNVKSQDKLPEA